MMNTANQNAMAPIMQHSMTMHQPIQQSAPQSMPPDDQDELKAYVNTLFDHRWLILWIALAATLIGVAYAFMAKPVYQASMMIHVEENSPNSSKNILGEMASLFDTKAEVTAEMELLHSRLVISRAVDNMRLYIDAHPKYFPLIGGLLARQNKQLSSPGVFGIGGYAWGAEKISVPVFNVPDVLQNREFVITAEGNGQYLLTESTQNIALKGKVGVALNAATDNGNIELMVDQMAAAPGAEFSLRRDSRLAAIEEVQSMMVTEQGKLSGIINVTLQGQNPQLTTNILNEIGREYMRQNLARKTEEAEKSLAFLNTQLPQLKAQLEQSEGKYNQFRNAHGTIDLGEEARLSLQQSAAAKTRRIELQQKRTELLSRFTDEHPIVQGVNSQLREIDNEIREVAGHIKTLPTLEQDVVRLNRDVKVNTDLYTTLSNTAQQLRLITVGKVSNVRLIDAPMAPEKPLKPNRPLVIALAVLTGLFLGVISAFIKNRSKTVSRIRNISKRCSAHARSMPPSRIATSRPRSSNITRNRTRCWYWPRLHRRMWRSKACVFSAPRCSSRCRSSKTISS
ncbi:GNVR domain-containing protein [Undibacterium arcticum]|uniref:GNVR domain-containing protein n=1 Tax=Undibacterium arcticum TaxID=1762892 RepID=UPI00361A490D